MSKIARLVALFALTLGAAGPGSGDKELTRALAQWYRSYRAGKIELDEFARHDGRTDKMYGEDNLPKHFPAVLTHREAFQLLMGRAVDCQTVEVARTLLLLAAVGLDDERYGFEAAPYAVRRMSRHTLSQFGHSTPLDLIRRTAAGESKAWKTSEWSTGLQHAALRTLGEMNRSVFRPMIEDQLDHKELIVRTAAAEALEAMGRRQSLPAIERAIRRETEPAAAQALARRTSYFRCRFLLH